MDVDTDADVVDGDDGRDDASTALFSIVAEIPRGSGFDRVTLSTSLLPVILVSLLTSMLFSSMFLLPFGIIAESLDPPSLECNDAVLLCFVLAVFFEFACNCAGKAIHPTANRSNHIAPWIGFISFRCLRYRSNRQKNQRKRFSFVIFFRYLLKIKRSRLATNVVSLSLSLSLSLSIYLARAKPFSFLTSILVQLLDNRIPIELIGKRRNLPLVFPTVLTFHRYDGVNECTNRRCKLLKRKSDIPISHAPRLAFTVRTSACLLKRKEQRTKSVEEGKKVRKVRRRRRKMTNVRRESRSSLNGIFLGRFTCIGIFLERFTYIGIFLGKFTCIGGKVLYGGNAT